jgi:hypothetical protein
MMINPIGAVVKKAVKVTRMANMESQEEMILGLELTARVVKGAKHLKTEAKAVLVGGLIVQVNLKKFEVGRVGRPPNHLVGEQREVKHSHPKVMDLGLGSSRRWTVNKFSKVSSFWSKYLASYMCSAFF